MNTIEIIRPATGVQVCELLAAHGQAAVLHAGGTDLIVRINKGHLSPQIIIDLNRLEGLSNIEQLSDGQIRVGCMVRIAQLLKNIEIKKHYRALFDGLQIIGSVQIRNRATIAGNICNASPAADTVPPLMVLGATVNIRGLRGMRRVAIAEFFKGPGQTVLERDEFVQSIDLPRRAEKFRSAYMRLGRRNAVDCAIVGVAVSLDENQRARVAFGSVAATPIRAWALERALNNGPLDKGVATAAAELIDGIISPINDVRASQEYRRAVSRTLFIRAMDKVMAA